MTKKKKPGIYWFAEMDAIGGVWRSLPFEHRKEAVESGLDADTGFLSNDSMSIICVQEVSRRKETRP